MDLVSEEFSQSLSNSLRISVWSSDGCGRCWRELWGFDHQIFGAASQRTRHYACCVHQALWRDDCVRLFLPQGTQIHFGLWEVCDSFATEGGWHIPTRATGWPWARPWQKVSSSRICAECLQAERCIPNQKGKSLLKLPRICKSIERRMRQVEIGQINR